MNNDDDMQGFIDRYTLNRPQNKSLFIVYVSPGSHNSTIMKIAIFIEYLQICIEAYLIWIVDRALLRPLKDRHLSPH